MLQILQAVEKLSERETAMPEPPTRAEKENDLAPAGVGRMMRSLTRSPLPPSGLPASTVDGRSLGRIRRAVLRMSEAGWDGERIARRLRLGSGDVQLILKSSASGYGRPGVLYRSETAGTVPWCANSAEDYPGGVCLSSAANCAPSGGVPPYWRLVAKSQWDKAHCLYVYLGTTYW